MTQDEMMEIFQAAIMLAFKLAVPILLVAMIVGLVIAILQAATQVHEQTLSFAPKAVAVGPHDLLLHTNHRIPEQLCVGVH